MKDLIVCTALSLSLEKGYWDVTRDDIAKVLNVTGNNIQYHFGTMEALRNKVISRAIDEKILPVIAQGIIHGQAPTNNITKYLRKRALLSCV